MIKKPRIYIAGAMSGIAQNNFPAFFEKEKQLQDAGWEVINPARLDMEAGVTENTEENQWEYQNCAKRDIEVLFTCNAIYMLSGFQFSKGACWERALATHIGLKKYYEIPRADHEFGVK